MEEKKTTKATRTTRANNEAKEVKKSVKLLSLEEYLLGKPIRKEKKAAIKISLDENEFHTRKEWDSIMKKYED